MAVLQRAVAKLAVALVWAAQTVRARLLSALRTEQLGLMLMALVFVGQRCRQVEAPVSEPRLAAAVRFQLAGFAPAR